MSYLMESIDWTEMTIELLETSMYILLRSFTGATSSLETKQNDIWNVIESICRFGRVGVDVVTVEHIGTFSCNFAGDFWGLNDYQTESTILHIDSESNQNNVGCRITNEFKAKKSLRSLVSGVFKSQRAKRLFTKHQKHVQLTLRLVHRVCDLFVDFRGNRFSVVVCIFWTVVRLNHTLLICTLLVLEYFEDARSHGDLKIIRGCGYR